MTIKAIIFDVGGVLIRTADRTGRQKWAKRLGMEPWAYENFIFGGESGQAAQLGHKTLTEHWAWLRDHFQLTEAELREMRHDFFAGDYLNQELVDYIRQVKDEGKYRLTILSNYDTDARQLWSSTYPFLHLFEAAVISGEIGIMKPDPRSYEFAAVSVDVELDEAVFIDDTYKNIEGARAVGMSAVHFTETDEVLAQLNALLHTP